MTILLVGGTGLLGRQIKETLETEHDLISPSSEEFDLSKNIEEQIQTIKAETLVFAAQYRNYNASNIDEDLLYRINTLSLASIIKNSKVIGLKKIIYLSSGGIYKFNQAPVNENSPIQDMNSASPYFKSKIWAESILLKYQLDLDISILRLFNVYGHAANSSSLMPQLEKKLLHKTPINISSNGGDLLRPIHCKDVSRTLSVLIKKRQGTIVNIAGPELLNFRDIVERMASNLNVQPVFTETDKKSLCIAPDNHKFYKEFDQPEIKFTGNWKIP
jgi:nucleoside-diphosphate-sugar epimerase